MEIKIEEKKIMNAADEGMDAFLQVVTDAIYDAIGGELNNEAMGKLNNDQIVLLAYCIIRDEVMDGGFVQLIHNGYGGFIFLNPTAKMLKMWGVNDLAKSLYALRDLYEKYHERIERDCTDDEFMAMFEQFEEFDDYDDDFVENEELYTDEIAHYVDANLDKFCEIIK
jgi:hypothetical protein